MPRRTAAHTPPPEKQWFPWLIPTFFVANMIIFLVTMYENNCPARSDHPASCYASFLGRFSFQPLEENALNGPSTLTLINMGGLYLKEVDRIHEAWRLFSMTWLHAGVNHLLPTMLTLLFIGIPLEKKFGLVRIGLLYVIYGLGSSLLSALFLQLRFSVGASGAIAGLIGGKLSHLLTNWKIHDDKFFEMYITISFLACGIVPNADNFGHIGGLLSGFLLGLVLLIRPQYKRVSQTNSHSALPVHLKHIPYLWIISFMLLSVGLISGLVLFLKGVDMNDHCSLCYYLTSVSCNSSQIGNQLKITCLTNGRSGIFPLPSGNEQAEELCNRLCR